ncbi:hypothetical protein ACFQ0M_48530 [Kitasatospora aburaviensis]
MASRFDWYSITSFFRSQRSSSRAWSLARLASAASWSANAVGAPGRVIAEYASRGRPSPAEFISSSDPSSRWAHTDSSSEPRQKPRT